MTYMATTLGFTYIQPITTFEFKINIYTNIYISLFNIQYKISYNIISTDIKIT